MSGADSGYRVSLTYIGCLVWLATRLPNPVNNTKLGIALLLHGKKTGVTMASLHWYHRLSLFKFNAYGAQGFGGGGGQIWYGVRCLGRVP